MVKYNVSTDNNPNGIIIHPPERISDHKFIEACSTGAAATAEAALFAESNTTCNSIFSIYWINECVVLIIVVKQQVLDFIFIFSTNITLYVVFKIKDMRAAIYYCAGVIFVDCKISKVYANDIASICF